MTITQESKEMRENAAIYTHFTKTEEIEIHIPMEPIAKGRPRLTTRGGFARAYTPAKTARWEAGAAAFIRSKWKKRDPLVGPVMIDIMIYRSRPKRLCRKKDPNHALPCDTKPDVDNYVKAILDACEKANIFANGDQQVFSLNAIKMWAPKGKEGFVVVRVIR